jgi:hypothetical protein
MNSKFSYLYRDASNYKTFNEVIISGILSLKDIEPNLRERTFFIPSEVGLMDLQNSVFTSDDHIWHEIDEIKPTADQPTVNFNASKLLTKFKIAHQIDWNEYAVFIRKGLS